VIVALIIVLKERPKVFLVVRVWNYPCSNISIKPHLSCCYIVVAVQRMGCWSFLVSSHVVT